MNSPALKRIEIIQELSFIPDNQLDKVKTYLQSLLLTSNQPTPKNTYSLKGIWKDKGFEKIMDLEAEIKAARKQLSDSILNKPV
jgi:hypothetical protein